MAEVAQHDPGEIRARGVLDDEDLREAELLGGLSRGGRLALTLTTGCFQASSPRCRRSSGARVTSSPRLRRVAEDRLAGLLPLTTPITPAAEQLGRRLSASTARASGISYRVGCRKS